MASWLEDVEKALNELGGTGTYPQIYKKIRGIRKEPLPKTWEAIVRRTIETNSRQSANFAGNDLFYPVEGIGKGVWGLRKHSNKK